MSKKMSYWLSRVPKYYWNRFRLHLLKIYNNLPLYELVFFFFYLVHRYKPDQMDLHNVSPNIRALLQLLPGEWVEATRKGKLRILKRKRDKFLFSLRNTLLCGAPKSRLEKVVYYTYLTLTLELNNPFDKSVLIFFLQKKTALLYRLLGRVERLNGKKWDQSRINLNIDLFHRNSLIQYQVIRDMHRAVRRQKVPPLIQSAKAALERGLYPILITAGCSGSYWMRGEGREILGLFKPFDEEIHAPNNPIGPIFQGALGQRKTRLGCRVGEAPHHEVGAYLVDEFFGFGIVPRTYYATFTHRTFFLAREDRLSSHRPLKTKYGSFQEYVGGFVPFTKVFREERDKLPLVEYQLLIVLDVIIGNTDRNTGNILIGDEKIAAIDHALSFPDINTGFNFWYWEFAGGEEPLIPSLVELLEHFPFEKLFWKLRKRCFISINSLSRIRERVALFREGVRAGLVPKQMADLMKIEYLYPLQNYVDKLDEKACEQVELYKANVL